MPKTEPSDRLMLRLPEQIRSFLAFESGRTGMTYTNVIRSSLIGSKAWADWQKAVAVEAKAAERAARAAQPRVSLVDQRREREKREEIIRELVYYKDEHGHGCSDERARRYTWERYIREMCSSDWRFSKIPPYEFDEQLLDILQRRANYYSHYGVELPPLPDGILNFRMCEHGNPKKECEDCRMEALQIVAEKHEAYLKEKAARAAWEAE